MLWIDFPIFYGFQTTNYRIHFDQDLDQETFVADRMILPTTPLCFIDIRCGGGIDSAFCLVLTAADACKFSRKCKGKCEGKVNLYIVPSRKTSKALTHGSYSVTCNYLIRVHQMTPPQTEVANI